MFDLYAQSRVKLISMDIISTFTGRNAIEIYKRQGTWVDRDKSPSAWQQIASFNLYITGFSEPTRIPNGAFDEIEMFPGDLISFYITATNGPFIQLSPYPNTIGVIHETTDELVMFVGIGKNYPFLHASEGVAWNGRIYYKRVQTPMPTPSPTLGNQPVGTPENFCGLSRSDAAGTCDKPCPGGNDLECPTNQFCFLEISVKECEIGT